jgi:hypothetical protein
VTAGLKRDGSLPQDNLPWCPGEPNSKFGSEGCAALMVGCGAAGAAFNDCDCGSPLRVLCSVDDPAGYGGVCPQPFLTILLQVVVARATACLLDNSTPPCMCTCHVPHIYQQQVLTTRRRHWWSACRQHVVNPPAFQVSAAHTARLCAGYVPWQDCCDAERGCVATAAGGSNQTGQLQALQRG